MGKQSLRIADQLDQLAVYCMGSVHKPFENGIHNPENRPRVGRPGSKGFKLLKGSDEFLNVFPGEFPIQAQVCGVEDFD